MLKSGNKKLPKDLMEQAKGRPNKNNLKDVSSRGSLLSYLLGKLYTLLQIFVIIVAFSVVITYATMSVVNANRGYKERIIEYLVQNAPGEAKIKEVSLGWDGIFPSIITEDVTWDSDYGEISMQAQRAVLSINPVAPLYGGSIIFVKLQRGYLLVSQNWLEEDILDADRVKNDADLAAESPNLDIILEDYRLSLLENNLLLVDLERQVTRLRGKKQIIKAKGQVTYGVLPIMNFDSSLVRDEDGIDLYTRGDNLNLRDGWQDILKELEIYDDLKDEVDRLNRVRGSGKFWITQTKVEGLAIRTDILLDELSINNQQEINMHDVLLLGSIAFPDSGSSWDLVLESLKLNMNDAAGGSRRLEFANIGVTKDAAGIDIISPKVHLEDAGYLAVNIITQEKAIGNISGYDARGDIDNLRVSIRNAGEVKFSLTGSLVDVTTNPVGQIPGAINISGDLSITDGKGWFVLDDYDSDLYLPLLYPEPFHFGYARGIFMWEWLTDEGALLLVGSSYNIQDGDLHASMQISLYSIPTEHGYIDLEVGGGDMDIQQARTFIPWNAIQSGTSQWLDQALIAGTTERIALSMRGDVKYFGSDQTIFELGISMAEGALMYREDKEPIEAPRFDIYVTGEDIKVLMPEGGNIGEIAEVGYGYGLVDIASADFALGGEGEISLAATPELLYDYILKDDASVVDWQAKGVASGDWEFQYNLRSQEFLNAELNLTTSQSELHISKDPSGAITNITGSLGITEKGYLGDWSAHYQGEKIIGSFSDDDKGNVLKLSGILPVPDILGPYAKGKAGINIEAYTKARGELLLSDYKVTSDLRGVELNLPYPLKKNADAVLPFTFAKTDRGSYASNHLAFGRRLFLGWRDKDKSIAGLELSVPSRRAASPNSVIVPRGLLVNLAPQGVMNFDAWQRVFDDLNLADALSSEDAQSRSADKLYRDLYFEANKYLSGLSYGEVTIGEFELLGERYDYANLEYDYRQNKWLNFALQKDKAYRSNGRFSLTDDAYKVVADIQSIAIVNNRGEDNRSNNARLVDLIPKEINPPNSFSILPAIELTVSSVYYGDSLIGSFDAELIPQPKSVTARIKDSKLIGLKGTGEFSWKLNSNAASELSLAIGLTGDIDSTSVRNIAAREVDLKFDWSWHGSNRDFHKWYDSAHSSFAISSNRGSIVSERANVLINVISFLNLNSYVRAVSGDFSSWSNSNSTVTYRGANLGMDLEEGKYVLRDNSKITLSFIKIDGSGSYAIAADELDANVIVTSPTTSVLPITALILGASALAPLLISIDIAGGDFINRFSSAVYRVNGTLASPESSLVRISDVSGKKLEPDDLANQIDIRSRLDNFKF